MEHTLHKAHLEVTSDADKWSHVKRSSLM